MKKWIYSIIIIICTTISVSVMCYLGNSTAIIDGFQLYEIKDEEAGEYGSEKYVINEIESKNKDSIKKMQSQPNYFDGKEFVSEEKNKEVINDSNGTKNSNSSEDVEVNCYEGVTEDNTRYNYNNEYNFNDSYKYYSGNRSAYNNKTTTKDNSEEEIDGLLNEETTTVFKINKNTIPSKISNKDKLKMLKMANSLSVKDYKAVAENIKRSDELPAAVDIFAILRAKLSNENYKELKVILNPYINIELIEKNINKTSR